MHERCEFTVRVTTANCLARGVAPASHTPMRSPVDKSCAAKGARTRRTIRSHCEDDTDDFCQCAALTVTAGTENSRPTTARA